MPGYVVRPISDRTTFTGKHHDSQFTVTWSQAEQLLLAELGHLKARDVVIEIDVPEHALRLDGRLRSNAKADSPAVRIAFDSSMGPLVYATDKFQHASYRWNKGMQEHWQHNVYAIAKGLEALRLVDRYGITKRGEQYAGWKQLPAGSGDAPSHMTRDKATAVMDGRSLRVARALAHPDRHGGDRSEWDQVEQAATALGLS